MNSLGRFTTFLAQKVVHHRNQAIRFETEANGLLKEKKVDEASINIVLAGQHAAIANSVEQWVTELKTGGLPK